MFRKLTLIAALFLGMTPELSWANQDAIINPAAAQTPALFKKRAITFTNNITDLTLLHDFSDEQLEAVTTLLENVTVMVNGKTIASGRSMEIPLDSSVYKITLRMKGRDVQPLLNTIHDAISELPNRSHRLPLQIMHKTGMMGIIASMVHLEIVFEARVDATTQCIELMYPIIDQIELWETEKPDFKLRYSLPFTFELKIADNKLL